MGWPIGYCSSFAIATNFSSVQPGYLLNSQIVKRSQQTTPKIRRTDRYKITLSYRQKVTLSFVMSACEGVYNWALDLQKKQYELWKADSSQKKHLSLFDLQKLLTECRKAMRPWLAVPVEILRSALERLDEAFQGFFRRVAAGETPGFPRHRNGDRYDSFFSRGKGR